MKRSKSNVRHWSCNSHLSTKHTAISNDNIVTNLNRQKEQIDSQYDNFNYGVLPSWCGGKGGRGLRAVRKTWTKLSILVLFPMTVSLQLHRQITILVFSSAHFKKQRRPSKYKLPIEIVPAPINACIWTNLHVGSYLNIQNLRKMRRNICQPLQPLIWKELNIGHICSLLSTKNNYPSRHQ